MDYVKERSIEFAKWLIITKMWQSDLTFDELYEIFIDKIMVDEYEFEKEGKEALLAQWDV
jgi:hypothetical protein